MSDAPPADARMSPASARNRQVILQVLAARLPIKARVLEIASGAGEHAAFIAGALPGVSWQPSDPDAGARASIAAWRDKAGLPNLAEPLALDAADLATWPSDTVDAVVGINMIHIAPWAATEGLMAGTGRRLAPGGRLFLYSPYVEADVPTAPSNLAFDDSLKARNPAWGLRKVADVTALAARNGLAFAERIAMPANNLTLIFEKT